VRAQEETSRLADNVESTSDFVSIADLRTRKLVYLNRAARLALGLGDIDVRDLDAGDLYTPMSAERVRNEAEPRLLAGQGWSGELEMRRPDGEPMQVWLTFSPGRDADDEIRWVSALGRDVTERRRLEARLAHQATHDPLTNLPNRTRLLQLLEDAFDNADPDSLISLLFLDLDRFKQVNDTYGHDTGDLLLAQVADRIRAVLRPSDTVARLGGDEFVILCEDIVDEAHALGVAKRIASAIEGRPFVLGDVELPVTSSVGVAISSLADAHSEALLRDADAAMYRAKDQGRARLELFDDAMRRRNALRLELTDQLADGLERGEIRVHYQPCVDLRTGHTIAMEALARWQHPERGLLNPKEFIGLAEETGLIVGLGLAVLTAACEQGARWEAELGERAPRIHVNLSPRQILAPNLPALVRGVLERTDLDPRRLCLEITESVLMDDTDVAVSTLSSLKRLGVGLAIDDFGTGYSSLSYLRRFPVDVLKIDGSFVETLGPDPADSAFVGAIVNLAHSLGLEAIAEGVETQEQLARLRLLGCQGAQGYYFAPPRPAEALDVMVRTAFPL
jgi:diguanylate cyclase (GGDEF)-like protein/PAS domain S-box-containing protein